VVLDNYELDSEAPVLIIGAAGIDIIGRLQGPLEPATSNPARIRTSFGGTARNVAENLARLGQPVQLLSVIGGDQVGRQLLRHTEKAGVDVSGVQVAATLPTGSYLAVIDTQGQMNFGLDDMRVLDQITPDYLLDQKDLFKSASMLFLDANLHPDTLRAAFELAVEAGLPVCADPTSTSLATKLASHFKQLLFAIVTLSEFGLAYASAEGSGHIPAIKTEIVDPTGAGDALSAAVMFALLNDIPADEAVRLGLSAASLTLRRRGSVRDDLSLELLYDQLVI
jgi:pseudouridine kinase